MPDHQRSDVTEGAEGTTCIGRHDDIDTGNSDKTSICATHSHHNWLVSGVILSFAISKEQPEPITDHAELQHGAWVVVGLFILTIVMAVTMHNVLHLPPVVGMMTGLGFLKLFGYYLARRDVRIAQGHELQMVEGSALGVTAMHEGVKQHSSK